MRRSIVIALVAGALGVACKKGNEQKQDPAKVSENQTPTDKGKDKAKPPAAGNAVAAAGVQAGGIQRDDKEGPAAVLKAATGTVEVRRLGETKYEAAKADTKLYAGDVIRTGEKSTATIALADESVVEVAEVSSVGVGSRNGTADPASSAAVLTGLARFTVTPRAPAEGPFRVYTASGLVVSRGTAFGVGVAASGEARVGVETGQVDVLGIAQLDAKPIAVNKASMVVIAADGKVGTAAPWPVDDWGTWRDETDAKVKLDGALDAHGEALVDLNKALADGYGELQVNADGAATFEANAATAAEKNDPAAYTAAQADGAIYIDASFLLAARIETLTWAYASHAALATDLYVRHPKELEAKWTVVAPSVDAAILWPKRFEVTGVAYFEPLRGQYYIHHPRGRLHAPLVGIAVPAFYASVQPPQIDPIAVRGKLKGQVWIAPDLNYKVQARPIWIAAPAPSWDAKVKVAVAPPRAKMAWYVRPPTLKANVLLGANVTGNYVTKLDVRPPEPRAAIAAAWTVPVGVKIKVAPPDLGAAASARAKVKLGADGRLVAAPPAIKGGAKVGVGVGVNAPDVKVKVKAPDVKAGIHAHAGAGVKAGADVKSHVDSAVKAGANIKVKAPEVKVKAPEVKLKGQVKGEAKGGFKIGN